MMHGHCRQRRSAHAVESRLAPWSERPADLLVFIWRLWVNWLAMAGMPLDACKLRPSDATHANRPTACSAATERRMKSRSPPAAVQPACPASLQCPAVCPDCQLVQVMPASRVKPAQTCCREAQSNVQSALLSTAGGGGGGAAVISRVHRAPRVIPSEALIACTARWRTPRAPRASRQAARSAKFRGWPPSRAPALPAARPA